MYSFPVENLFLQQRKIYVLHNTPPSAWKFHYIANLIFFYRILNFFPPEYLINYVFNYVNHISIMLKRVRNWYHFHFLRTCFIQLALYLGVAIDYYQVWHHLLYLNLIMRKPSNAQIFQLCNICIPDYFGPTKCFPNPPQKHLIISPSAPRKTAQ